MTTLGDTFSTMGAYVGVLLGRGVLSTFNSGRAREVSDVDFSPLDLAGVVFSGVAFSDGVPDPADPAALAAVSIACAE